MPLLPDQLDDFINLTLKNYTKTSWVDISLDLQEYVFMTKFVKNGITEDGGSHLNWKVQHSNTGSFQDSELYGVDKTAVTDLTTAAEVPWTKQTVNFKYDVDEDTFQSDSTRIIREVEIRKHSMFNDFAEGMEERLWTTPSTATGNPRKPYGIPYWIVNSTTAAFGFNGLHPGNHTTVAGISRDNYPNWRNGTFTYVTTSESDLYDKWSQACEFCKFQAPHSFEELGAGESPWGFYTVYSVLSAMQRSLKASNDNIGSDVARYRGAVFFKGNPVHWVPALTDSNSAAFNTNDPIYGINWKTFNWVFQKGKNMVMHKPIMSAGQHTSREVHMDNWGQFKCINSRQNFVGYKAA